MLIPSKEHKRQNDNNESRDSKTGENGDNNKTEGDDEVDPCRGDGGGRGADERAVAVVGSIENELLS